VVVAAIVAVVASVLVVGRGSASPVASAATKTLGGGSAHVSFALVLRSPKLAAGKTLRLQGSGAVDKTGAEMSVNLASLKRDVRASGVPSFVHAILVSKGGDLLSFVHLTPIPSFTGGKGWIEIDLSTLASAHGVDLGALAAAGSAETPSQILDLLRTAGAAVTNLGPARVGGVPTTHYRILVDASEVGRVAGLTSALLGNRSGGAASKVPVNVWIGRSDGLLRRVGLVLRRGTGRASFSVSLSDDGANVSISPPPSSDVFNATGFLSGLVGLRSSS
jgi:hypothetical protein